MAEKNAVFLADLDALTPAMAVFAIAFHLSNLASGAGFGSPTKLPWGTDLWGATRHPVQIYEALTGALILFLLWPDKISLPIHKPGDLFLQFVALSPTSRLFFEAFHGNSTLILGGLRGGQIAAWLILAASLYLLHQQNARTQAQTAQVE